MNMNKILLVLIIASGFLLIFYANNDIFKRKNSFNTFQNKNILNDLTKNNLFDDYNITQYIKRSKYMPNINNTNEYNIFIIYTKENNLLKNKFELFLKSLLKYSTVTVHLHIICDEKSENSVEFLIKSQIINYKKIILYTLYGVDDCAIKITDIVYVMMQFFSSNAGSYYRDPLFYLSLGLHTIVSEQMKRAILIDCDVVFRTDVKQLFNEFESFSSENLFGLAPELTPVYRHILYKYRAKYTKTNFGNPYFNYPLKNQNYKKHSHLKHGYPGLNSGVVMLNFERIRTSIIYEEILKIENIKKLVGKYSFRGHLGDQDFYTLIGYEYPDLIYQLDCVWNRQLCTWWKDHGYSDIFDQYFHCEGNIKLYHGNCNTRVPE